MKCSQKHIKEKIWFIPIRHNFVRNSDWFIEDFLINSFVEDKCNLISFGSNTLLKDIRKYVGV